jgi:phage baseplate assembly protein W
MADRVQSDSRVQRFLDYPFSVSGAGTPNTTTVDDHIRDMIMQVLFTNPGERVNLPEFGVGVHRLVFAPASDALRSSVQFLVSTNLQRWLGDQINVDQVNVTTDTINEGMVLIEIMYTLKSTAERARVEIPVQA